MARIGFPPARGCSVLSDNPLARCTAERDGGGCRLCVRGEDFPAPAKKWDGGPGWSVISPRPDIQAVHFDRGRWGWAAVVFAGQRLVHGQFPPIVCADRKRALELVFARAWQIEPGWAINPFSDDGSSWRCRGLTLLVADPFG